MAGNLSSVSLLGRCVCFLEASAVYGPKAAERGGADGREFPSRCLRLSLKFIICTVAADSGRLAQWLARLVYTE